MNPNTKGTEGSTPISRTPLARLMLSRRDFDALHVVPCRPEDVHHLVRKSDLGLVEAVAFGERHRTDQDRMAKPP